MDLDRQIRQALPRFARDQRGGLTMQAALAFAGFGLALALLGAPMIQSASTQYAENQSPGIDRMTTSSISSSNGDRYTIRKSVLWKEPQILCGTKITPACLPGNR